MYVVKGPVSIDLRETGGKHGDSRIWQGADRPGEQFNPQTFMPGFKVVWVCSSEQEHLNKQAASFLKTVIRQNTTWNIECTLLRGRKHQDESNQVGAVQLTHSLFNTCKTEQCLGKLRLLGRPFKQLSDSVKQNSSLLPRFLHFLLGTVG